MEILLFSKLDIHYDSVFLEKDFLSYKSGSYPIDNFIEILKKKSKISHSNNYRYKWIRTKKYLLSNTQTMFYVS